MEIKQLKIDIGAFDRELAIMDSYGRSIVICNFLTCQKLLNESNLKGLYNYKGHDIYLDSNLENDKYLILPIINLDKLKERMGIKKYQEKPNYEDDLYLTIGTEDGYFNKVDMKEYEKAKNRLEMEKEGIYNYGE